jgi:hypothetical protein
VERVPAVAGHASSAPSALVFDALGEESAFVPLYRRVGSTR